MDILYFTQGVGTKNIILLMICVSKYGVYIKNLMDEVQDKFYKDEDENLIRLVKLWRNMWT